MTSVVHRPRAWFVVGPLYRFDTKQFIFDALFSSLDIH